MTQSPQKLGEVLTAGADYLATRKIEQPRLACELLAGRLLKCKHLELPLKYGVVLNEKLLEAMRRGIKRVADGEPVQYIIGQTDFMGHTFKTDKRALIPRPETEILVEQILKCDGLWGADNQPSVVDIGTGSGCIVISIALKKPDAKYLALDVSGEALELARENAAQLGVTDKIVFANVEISDAIEPESLDAIVSNPPYIPTSEYERLPCHIREHEPQTALDGGPNGLSVIEVIVQDAAIALKSGGFLFLEIGEEQTKAVRSMFGECDFNNIQVTKDLAGKDRIVSGIRT
ncbi:peptide chain release factor N(5)-glutamine methyltransferase [Verrucomicrobiota bacterium]